MTNTEEIEIRIKSIEQLFNSLDPAPFRERELDREEIGRASCRERV
mgnify:CR=1 FL=1